MNSDVQRVVNLVRMGEIRQIESNQVLKDVFEKLKDERIVSFREVSETVVSTDPNTKNHPKQVKKWMIDDSKLLKSRYGVE